MKNNKRLTSGKKLFVLFAVIVTMFVAVNIVWLFTIKLPLLVDFKNMDLLTDTSSPDVVYYYGKNIGVKRYVVHNVSYLDFDRAYSVSNNRNGQLTIYDKTGQPIYEEDKTYVSLRIVDELFKTRQYIVEINNEKQQLSKILFIDSELNLLFDEWENTELTEQRQKLLEDNYEEINEMLTTAKELWGL